MSQMLAIMLQTHIATYGPLPDDLGRDARDALAGDRDALLRLARALAERERAAT